MFCQIGKYSVTLSEGNIIVEHYTGDVMGNTYIKRKIIEVTSVADNILELKTNRGDGKITLQDSGSSGYCVELVLPRFIFGRKIIAGSLSENEKNGLRNELLAYNI